MREAETDEPAPARLAAAEAVTTARSALVRHLPGCRGFEVWRKDNSELVTSADLAADDVIGKCLAQFRTCIPRALGENEHVEAAFSKCWLVDPLCGTVPFSLGMSNWGVSVALQDSRRLIVGAFATSESSETWSGGAAIGAWRGSAPYSQTARHENLEECVVGFEKSHGATFPSLVSSYSGALQRAGHVHTYGSAVFMGAQVCAGRIAAALFPDSDPVHVAGVSAVAEGLGLLVTDGRGRPVDWAARRIDLVLIGTPLVHKQLLEALR